MEILSVSGQSDHPIRCFRLSFFIHAWKTAFDVYFSLHFLMFSIRLKILWIIAGIEPDARPCSPAWYLAPFPSVVLLGGADAAAGGQDELQGAERQCPARHCGVRLRGVWGETAHRRKQTVAEKKHFNLKDNFSLTFSWICSQEILLCFFFNVCFLDPYPPWDKKLDQDPHRTTADPRNFTLICHSLYITFSLLQLSVLVCCRALLSSRVAVDQRTAMCRPTAWAVWAALAAN